MNDDDAIPNCTFNNTSSPTIALHTLAALKAQWFPVHMLPDFGIKVVHLNVCVCVCIRASKRVDIIQFNNKTMEIAKDQCC